MHQLLRLYPPVPDVHCPIPTPTKLTVTRVEPDSVGASEYAFNIYNQLVSTPAFLMKPILLIKLIGRWSLTYLWLLTSSLSINAVAQTPNGTTVAGGNGAGSAANQLNRPSEVHVDRLGNIYIADYDNHRVQKWAPGATSGTTVAGGNGEGSGANQLVRPSDVYVDGSGNVYVINLGYGNHRVQKWAPGATSGTTVAGDGYGSGAN